MILNGDPVDLDSLRLRNEFLSLPGLAVTLGQTARLLSVRLDHARRLLTDLQHEGFLVCDDKGEYRRASVVFARDLEQASRSL
jgi:DNA-binding IclR family transcriptional regulator